MPNIRAAVLLAIAAALLMTGAVIHGQESPAAPDVPATQPRPKDVSCTSHIPRFDQPSAAPASTQPRPKDVSCTAHIPRFDQPSAAGDQAPGTQPSQPTSATTQPDGSVVTMKVIGLEVYDSDFPAEHGLNFTRGRGLAIHLAAHCPDMDVISLDAKASRLETLEDSSGNRLWRSAEEDGDWLHPTVLYSGDRRTMLLRVRTGQTPAAGAEGVHLKATLATIYGMELADATVQTPLAKGTSFALADDSFRILNLRRQEPPQAPVIIKLHAQQGFARIKQLTFLDGDGREIAASILAEQQFGPLQWRDYALERFAEQVTVKAVYYRHLGKADLPIDLHITAGM